MPLAFITLHGIVAFLTGVFMVFVGSVGLAVEALLARRRGRRGPAFWAMCGGPMSYALLGALLMVLADRLDYAHMETLDGMAWLVAVVGLVPWVALHAVRRARSHVAGEGAVS